MRVRSSRLLNRLLGGSNETLSTRCHRRHPRWEFVINILFLPFDRKWNHCKRTYRWERTMGQCRHCRKDIGIRYLLDDEFCSPECACDHELETTTFHQLDERFRRHEGDGQLDLFDEKKGRK